MESTSNTQKSKTGAISEILKRGLSSKLFPFVTAAFMLICYYLSLDIVAFYYITVTGILMLLLLDDITPFISLILFINVIVSYKNSPSRMSGESDYYLQPVIYIQLMVLIGMLAVAGFYRFFTAAHRRKFKPTPIFFGLCALSAAFLLNGILNKDYSAMNLMYGGILVFVYLGIFAIFKDNIKVGKETYKYIAYAFVALSVLLVVELAVSYLTYDNIYINGKLNRDALTYGWGVYNGMGLLLLLCIPAAIYLAALYRHGWLFTIYSLVLLLGCVYSTSRQAMIGAIVIYPLCLGLLFKKSKRKLTHVIVFAIAIVAAAILIALKWDSIYETFSQIYANIFVNGKLNGSGRFALYKQALGDFAASPFFGVGFFGAELSSITQDNVGLGITPLFYHETILQMAGSCGLIGLVAYTVHRTQTIVSFFKNITAERSFIAISMLVILILSLVDIHMFAILPTLIYSCLLAVLVASENPEKKKSLNIM